MRNRYYTRLGTTQTEGYPKSMMSLNRKTLALLESTAVTNNLWYRPSVVERFEINEDDVEGDVLEWSVCWKERGDIKQKIQVSWFSVPRVSLPRVWVLRASLLQWASLPQRA